MKVVNIKRMSEDSIDEMRVDSISKMRVDNMSASTTRGDKANFRLQ